MRNVRAPCLDPLPPQIRQHQQSHPLVRHPRTKKTDWVEQPDDERNKQYHLCNKNNNPSIQCIILATTTTSRWSPISEEVATRTTSMTIPPSTYICQRRQCLLLNRPIVQKLLQQQHPFAASVLVVALRGPPMLQTTTRIVVGEEEVVGCGVWRDAKSRPRPPCCWKNSRSDNNGPKPFCGNACAVAPIPMAPKPLQPRPGRHPIVSLYRIVAHCGATTQQLWSYLTHCFLLLQSALLSHPTNATVISAQPILLKMTSSNHSDDDFQEEEAFLIMNTGLAHKRVRVVQLLIIGLVGILMAWLGNFFVSSSCHFASIPVSVGQYGDVYPLHFGLWNYSPVDSALNGYKYCYPYNSKNSNSNSGSSHQGEAPVLSRIFNLSALLAGTFSLTVLWIYLISGRIISKFWKAAVFAATTAGILQMVTPLIFFTTSQLCRSAQCSVGPAAALSAVTAVAWVIVAAELHYHCPVVGTAGTVQESGSGVDEKTAAIMSTTNNEGLESRNLSHGSDATTPVAQLEMSDLANASHEYFDRFQYTRSSLRQYRPPDMSELS